MILDEKILKCEYEYTKCFSEFYEDENIIRYRDNQLKDMYCHNYTHIKKAMSESELKRIIEDEISLRLSEKSDFCNIYLNPDVSTLLISTLKHKPEISTTGYYSFDTSNFSRLKALPDCIIKRATSQEMIEDILYCDLQLDEKRLGKDFCTRRCYRRGQIYISDKGIDSYVCYHNGNRIGTCNLFMHNGVTKIEDFSVIPRHQRKGYGTTILKALIDIATKENSHTIYLVTDEDDTAKEMYKKIGFNKIGERIDLFFRL